ncbi:MAG: serine hydrolase domain-containing protein [Pacificimonas sp.]|jgi:CubicO group peptidase (beta-lactamase class C family)|nr:serine hydrolase domain-containing protein [Pacificimonas sp.]
MKRTKTALAIGGAVVAAAISTQTLASATADRDAALRAAEAWMTKQMHVGLVPGATAAIVHDQDLIWSTAYGFADREAGTPMTAETDFSVCSISKLFTSIGVMTLVEDGRVDLDDPLTKFLPNWAFTEAARGGSDQVTIRDMLSHAAGFPREPMTTGWANSDFPTTAEVLAQAGEVAPLYEPADTWQYSNLAMSLLGQVIEAASGTDYDSYIRSEVLAPLNLRGISTDLPLESTPGRPFSRGYFMYDEQAVRPVVEPYTLNGYAPAAGFAASVIDLAEFASWQFRVLETGETEVLSRPALRNMHRVHWYDPADENGNVWGFGFSHMKINDQPFIGHGGYCPGYRAQFAMNPATKTAFAAMVNVNDASPYDLVAGIEGIVGPVLAAEPSSDESAADDANEPVLSDFEGRFGQTNFPYEMYVAPRGDDLLVYNLYSREPARNATTLKHQGGDRFRALNGKGNLGAEATFNRDESGRVVSLHWEGETIARMD